MTTIKSHKDESATRHDVPGSERAEKPEKEEREENLDKTIEDSFPASDPPSSIPDPEDDESAA